MNRYFLRNNTKNIVYRFLSIFLIFILILGCSLELFVKAQTEFSNVALGNNVIADCSNWAINNNCGTDKLTDGDVNTISISNNSDSADTAKEIYVELNSFSKINEVQLFPYYYNRNGFPEDFTIEAYTSSGWKQVCSMSGVEAPETMVSCTFQSVEASAVRIKVTKLGMDGATYVLILSEIKVMGSLCDKSIPLPIEFSENIAPKSEVFAECDTWGYNNGFVAENLIDDNTNTYTWSNYENSETVQKEVYLLFDKTYHIYSLDLWAIYSKKGFPVDFTIEAYTKEGWKQVYSGIGTEAVANLKCDFGSVDACAVRLKVNRLGQTEQTDKYALMLSEIKVTATESTKNFDVFSVVSDTYTVKNDVIYCVDRNTDTDSFKSCFYNDFDVEILSTDEILSTGSQVTLKHNVFGVSKNFTVAITSDISGDGRITAEDLVCLRHYLTNEESFDSAHFIAADINTDNAVNIIDLVRLKKNLINISNIYYVDSDSESGNDGLSVNKAFKTLEEVNNIKLNPGDKVLFKRGSVWDGQLCIDDSGTESEPIVFSSYGSGEDYPQINANGNYLAAIQATDASWIEISNLEVTNKTEEIKPLRGIFVNAFDSDVRGIKIKGCYVHDVTADPQKPDVSKLPWEDEHWNGGIVVRSGGTSDSRNDIKLDNVIIEDNYVTNCCLTGISAGTTMVSTYPKTTNLKILNNYVSDCYGDGIIAFFTDGALIEGNVSDHNGASNDADSYYAGIWVIGADNTVMQYNEAFGQGISGDGQGFDVDVKCNNTLLQYNYSHDNYGGFLLLMEQNSGKVTVRYNLSVNDGGFIQVTRRDNPTSNIYADIYNNTFYTKSDNFERLFYLTNTYVSDAIYANCRNNIFCYEGDNSPLLCNREQFYNNLNFGNNCYYGFEENLLPTDDENKILLDPQFVDFGNSAVGINNTLGYRLLSSSSCIGAGSSINDSGEYDFWGNPIRDVTNIGAYAGSGIN